MDELKMKLAALIEAANTTVEGAVSAKRALTSEEQSDLEAKHAEIAGLQKTIKAVGQSQSLIAGIGEVAHAEAPEETGQAKSLGEHFVKAVGSEGLSRVKTTTGTTVAAPEWRPRAKAADDTHSTGDVFAPWTTDFDRTVVRGFRRPVVSDLLGAGSLSGNAVTYLVEGAVEGGFSTVAEGGAKPQFHMADPTTRTDALKKIAGFLKFTDEMAEDTPFWVSEINQRGLYLLALAEENQLLNGPGTGSTVLGLLNRDGIQTETSTGAADNADAIFRAISAVQTATGLSADGLIINPADYQALRLAKDGNDQYYGGGFFAGQYGNGGITEQPPVWGLRTVVSAAAAAGSPVVGAFNAAATVYRKGGVRVESTNSHEDDFTNNLITTRIEERVALAVRIPAAFVQVTLAGNGEG